MSRRKQHVTEKEFFRADNYPRVIYHGRIYMKAIDVARMYDTHVNNIGARCRRGKIPGAIKPERSWLIPESVAKKLDIRKKAEREKTKKTASEAIDLISKIKQSAAYSATDAAKMLGLSLTGVQYHLGKGSLKGTRERKGLRYFWRIKGTDLIAFIREGAFAKKREAQAAEQERLD